MHHLSDRSQSVHKIAVLRANALGDFAVALPAIEALRAAYPRAEIVLLGKSWHESFLSERPGPIDRVVVVPPYGGVTEQPGFEANVEEVETFFHAMQQERFDLAVQIHGGGRYSNGFVLRLGARRTVGLKTSDAPPLDQFVPYIDVQHEIIRYLEVVSLVGAKPVGLEPQVSVIQRDLEEAYALVPDTRDPIVALHPGASDLRRRWPPKNFAAVGDALADAGALVVVTGTESESKDVEGVVTSMRRKALNLCGRLSLSGLSGLLSRCAVVVSNDSGPRHLAAAVGARTVGIYWCYNLVNFASLTRTRHRSSVSWQIECSVCGMDSTKGKCKHTESFVANVTVDEVRTSALALLHDGSDSALPQAV